MQVKEVVQLIVMVASLLLGVVALVFRARIKATRQEDEATAKAIKKKRTRLMMLSAISLWLGCGLVIGRIPHEAMELHFSIFAPRWDIFGMSVSSSVVMAVIATLIITILCILIRVFVIPRFQKQPKGLQTLLETAVESVSSYTHDKSHGTGDNLSAYALAIAMLLIVSAILELFAQRPPTADLIMTLSLALCTFVLVNAYGVKVKGVGGRLKSFTKPVAIMVPFKLLSELANPISLACRLFGNMLGGMIVIELVYVALGNFGVGIPAVLGLYFNLFHPVIQTFIFITLSLTFINEATEEVE